jgi:hypothetical protein
MKRQRIAFGHWPLVSAFKAAIKVLLRANRQQPMDAFKFEKNLSFKPLSASIGFDRRLKICLRVVKV